MYSIRTLYVCIIQCILIYRCVYMLYTCMCICCIGIICMYVCIWPGPVCISLAEGETGSEGGDEEASVGLQAQTKADSSRVLEVRTLVTLGMGLHRAIPIRKKYPFCSCLYVYPPPPNLLKTDSLGCWEHTRGSCV